MVEEPYNTRIQPLLEEYQALIAQTRGTESAYAKLMGLEDDLANSQPEDIKRMQEEASALDKEIQVIYREKEIAVEELKSTSEMKALLEEAQELLCA